MKNCILFLLTFFALQMSAQIAVNVKGEQSAKGGVKITTWQAIDHLERNAPHLLKFVVPLNVDTFYKVDTSFIERSIPGKTDTVRIVDTAYLQRLDTVYFARETPAPVYDVHPVKHDTVVIRTTVYQKQNVPSIFDLALRGAAILFSLLFGLFALFNYLKKEKDGGRNPTDSKD